MSDLLNIEGIRRMLSSATAQIRANQELLSRLDGAVGDGDHGTSILRAMEAMEKSASEFQGEDLKQMFAGVAWAVMACDCGSTGPLLGAFFNGMADATQGKTGLNCSDMITMFDGGVAKLHKMSRAQIGDKTMMDAFLPALAAMKTADPAFGFKAVLKAACDAAIVGSEATKGMRAKFGRARNLGDRVIGHPDPGSVSVSLIFKGFYEALN